MSKDVPQQTDAIPQGLDVHMQTNDRAVFPEMRQRPGPLHEAFCGNIPSRIGKAQFYFKRPPTPNLPMNDSFDRSLSPSRIESPGYSTVRRSVWIDDRVRAKSSIPMITRIVLCGKSLISRVPWRGLTRRG